MMLLLFAPFFLFGESLAKEFSRGLLNDTVGQNNGIHRYSVLFRQAETLLKGRKPAAALKKVEGIYGCGEVPVQAFYDTLDRFKIKVIEGLRDEYILRSGNETLTVLDLKTFFIQALLPRPDILYYTYLTQGELPFNRYLLLNLLYGRKNPKQTENPLLEWASPYLDLFKAVESSDPWIVSAALFVARKRGGAISPQAVVDRWQRRPDLWDDICTEQAMLYLAGFGPETLLAVQVSNEDIKTHVRDLLNAPAKGRSRAQILGFNMAAAEPNDSRYLTRLPCEGLKIMRLTKADAKSAPKKTVRRWSGDKSTPYKSAPLENHERKCIKGLLTLPPGRYSLKYIRKRVQGRQCVFDCQKCRMTRVVIPVFGQI
jgi:hypothetical protein